MSPNHVFFCFQAAPPFSSCDSPNLIDYGQDTIVATPVVNQSENNGGRKRKPSDSKANQNRKISLDLMNSSGCDRGGGKQYQNSSANYNRPGSNKRRSLNQSDKSNTIDESNHQAAASSLTQLPLEPTLTSNASPNDSPGSPPQYCSINSSRNRPSVSSQSFIPEEPSGYEETDNISVL